MMCYERSCRLCLKDLIGPGIDCTSIIELRDAINVLFEVKIIRSDTTRAICNKCFENVMAFKAFKKTVAECQAIIKDYELIRRKIVETRAIKEEVIDLSETSENHTSRTKRKKPITNPVTDSQINDILDIVHDSTSSNKTALKVSSSNAISSANKKTKQTFVSPLPINIKTEPGTSTTTSLSPTVSNTEAEKSNEPISSTSRDTIEKTTQNGTDKRDSVCSTSTSGIDSSIDVSKVVVKKEPQSSINIGSEVSQSIDANNETVSSSVQFPVGEQQGNETGLSSPVPKGTSTPIAVKERRKTLPLLTDLTQTNTTVAREDDNLQRPSPLSAENTITNDFLSCSICAIQCKTAKDLESHMAMKHTQKDDINKLQNVKNKQIKRIKDESLLCSSDDDKLEVCSMRSRCSRRAKTQALKKMNTTPPKRRNSSISPTVSKKGRSNKVQNTSTKMEPPLHPASVPRINPNISNTSNDSFSPTITLRHNPHINNDLSPPAENRESNQIPHMPKETSVSDKKRIITITLLRTKDSVNFRYCDQYKHSIDFNSVSPEELQDIRNSLMIPEIWANLTNVFKTSPPDERTIEQLRTIFGEKFEI